MKISLTIIGLVLPCCSTFSFITPNIPSLFRTRTPLPSLFARRYGPREDDISRNTTENFFDGQEEWEIQDEKRTSRQKVEFEALLKEILSAERPDELPSITSKYIDLILSMRGYEGVTLLKNALEEAEASKDPDKIEAVGSAVDYIMTFAEEFVDQAQTMDGRNKGLLGKVIKAMTGKDDMTEKQKEELLDELLEKERKNFSPGFLRHVEGECARIASAPKITPDSAKMLQTLRLVQLRIVEELGKDLGEGAQILNQIIGYDTREERIAVLKAGLMVRGVSFAKQLSQLSKEALRGFQDVPGDGVDPDLVERVTEIHDTIEDFIEEKSAFQ